MELQIKMREGMYPIGRGLDFRVLDESQVTQRTNARRSPFAPLLAGPSDRCGGLEQTLNENDR